MRVVVTVPGREVQDVTMPKGDNLRDAKPHSLIPQRHLRLGPGPFWGIPGLAAKVIKWNATESPLRNKDEVARLFFSCSVSSD